MKSFILLIAMLLAMVVGCQDKPGALVTSTAPQLYASALFKEYWYSGKAEINAYNLLQVRYGEVHQGKAVLIFVTEDFSKTKQVKLDRTDDPDKVSVLKLNFTKNFITGIYPYSMMLSVFTPVSRDLFPNTLKTTMSSQEWCGHVYSQLNLRGNVYKANAYSYFEKEGDTFYELPKTILEDEIWNIIRLSPSDLPVGDVNLIPGSFHTRLNHEALKTVRVTALKTVNANTSVYSIVFPNQSRKLDITFANTFPHTILGWQEAIRVKSGETMTTEATLDKTLFTNYWTKNKNEFRPLRDSLGLSIH
jgi:hypothetical protein